ncbi:MAG: alpha/beta fold hydrolase [Gemmatimonadetes bacterium]|nr:alpha/beta fold hydrolase [Gemmatimonadota bacterium]
MPRIVIAMIGATSACLMRPSDCHAQVAPPAVAYLYIMGKDTIATETIAQASNGVAGVLRYRSQPRIEWRQEGAGHELGTLSLTMFAADAPAGAAPTQRVRLRLVGDSAMAEMRAGSVATTRAFPTIAGALPLLDASVLQEVLLARLTAMRSQSSMALFLMQGAQTITAAVAQAGDTLRVVVAGNEVRAVFDAADGMPSRITTSRNLRVVRASGAVALPAMSAPMPGYDAPAGAPYAAEHVRIPTGRGYDLAATLTRPHGVSKMPVVITISGSGPQERDSRLAILPGYAIFREIADTLGRRGIAVLRFDDRGVGGSGGLETASTMTTAGFADDVRAIVVWLRARTDLDGARIALAGHSEGGVIAPMVASTDPGIKAIVLLAGPAYTGLRVSLFQNRQSVDATPGLTRAQRDPILASVPSRLDSAGKANAWLGFWLTHDPVALAKTVRQPMLVLQGLTDAQVTPEQADTLAAAFRAGGNTTVTVRTFAATNHLFLDDPSGDPAGCASLRNAHVRPEVLGAMADWLAKTLR